MFPVSGIVYTPPPSSGGSGGGGSGSGGSTGLTTQEVQNLIATSPAVTNKALETSPTLDSRIIALSNTVGGISGVSQNSVWSWIRGNGLFRPINTIYGGTYTMNDDHWHSFTVFEYLSGASTTFNVTQPSGALVNVMVPYAKNSNPAYGTPQDAPAGVWTLLINANQVGSVTINFPTGPSVIGRAVDGSYFTGSSFTLGQGHMCLLMYISSNHYYVCII